MTNPTWNDIMQAIEAPLTNEQRFWVEQRLDRSSECICPTPIPGEGLQVLAIYCQACHGVTC